jgi:hypothetical protein
MIDVASKMIQSGRSMDLMPREASPEAPITAYRYFSLEFFSEITIIEFMR